MATAARAILHTCGPRGLYFGFSAYLLRYGPRSSRGCRSPCWLQLCSILLHPYNAQGILVSGSFVPPSAQATPLRDWKVFLCVLADAHLCHTRLILFSVFVFSGCDRKVIGCACTRYMTPPPVLIIYLLKRVCTPSPFNEPHCWGRSFRPRSVRWTQQGYPLGLHPLGPTFQKKSWS